MAVTTLSTITCSKATIGSTATITINKAKPAYLHTIEYTFKSFSGTIVEKYALGTYEWTIPTDFYNELTNGMTGVATLHCTTYDGTWALGTTSYDVTIYANPYDTPTIAPIIKDSYNKTIELTGNENMLVRYRSIANVTINATAKNGATITSTKITNAGDTRTTATASFLTVQSEVFLFEATDSRGLSTAISMDMVVAGRWIEYNIPTCNIGTNKPDANGNMTVECSGTWWNSNFGAADNTITAQYRYKVDGGTYGSWTSMSVTNSGNNYSASASLTGLDYQETYVFQTRVLDALSTINSAEYKAKSIPVFSWSKDDFEFNVPVSFEGDTMTDFVIEQGTEAMGTNGTWYWRKWKSGRADCYGCRNYGNMGIPTLWGGFYRSATFSQTYPSGLFIAIPDFVDMSLRNGGLAGWVLKYQESAPTKDDTGSFIVVRPDNSTISQAYICFNIIGRWK